MERLPLEALKGGDEFGTRALREACPAPIHWIPDQGVPDMRHMDADLMGSAGFQLHFNKGVRLKTLGDSIMRHGGFAVGTNGKALSVTAVTTDGKIDGAAAGQGALHKRQVLAVHGVGLELFDQPFVGLDGAGHHQEPAGIFINPMHDAGSRNLVEGRVVMQQGILECPVMVSRGRVNHQPLGLVDHDEGLILVDDVERNGLRCDLGDHVEDRGEDHVLAAEEFLLGFCRLPIHGDDTGSDPVLNPVAGIVREELA